jgi:hypothetical protein
MRWCFVEQLMLTGIKNLDDSPSINEEHKKSRSIAHEKNGAEEMCCFDNPAKNSAAKIIDRSGNSIS